MDASSPEDSESEASGERGGEELLDEERMRGRGNHDGEDDLDEDDDDEEDDDEDEDGDGDDDSAASSGAESDEDEENSSDQESYVAGGDGDDDDDDDEDDDDEDDDDDDDQGGSSDDDVNDEDLDNELLAARERILAEKERDKLERRAAKAKKKRARQAKLRKLKKMQEELRKGTTENDDDQQLPRNPAAKAQSSTTRKRIHVDSTTLTMSTSQRSSGRPKKRLARSADDDLEGTGKRTHSKGQAQLIIPKSGWKPIPPLVEDFVESTLRGVCPLLLSLPRVERMRSKEKERLLRYLNECCNRIMEEVPQLTVPSAVAVGANDFPDLSRRIQYLKQSNIQRDEQIEAVIEELDKHTEEVSRLAEEFTEINKQLQDLEAPPAQIQSMPSFLEPFRKPKSLADSRSQARHTASSSGSSSTGNEASKVKWAHTFQTLVGL